MNLFKDRCTELSTKCAQLKARTKDKQRESQLDTINDGVQRCAEGIEPLIEPLAALRDEQVYDGKGWDQAHQLLEIEKRLTATMEKARSTPDDLYDPQDQTWFECNQLARSLERGLRTLIDSEWKTLIDKETQGRTAPYTPFANLEGCRGLIEQLEGKEREAAELKDHPPTKRRISDIRARGVEIARLIEALPLKDQPKEKLDMLAMCARHEGLPLSELTSEQLKWLQEEGFAESLKIRG